MQVHFLTPYLEDALTAALGGRRTSVHTTVLAWDVGAKSLEVRAQQVIIRQSDGTPLVTLPTVDVKLSAGALVRGTVALTAINIEDVSGFLNRTPEGTFEFGASSADTPPPEQLTPDAAERSTAVQQSQVIADLVQNLVAVPGTVSPLATLQELRVARGTLVVQDRSLGVTWHVTQFDLTLHRHPHGLTGTGHITLAWQDALTSVDATLAYERATEKLTLDTTFTDLRPSAVATVVPALQAVAGVDVPLSGKLAAALDTHGQLHNLRFQLNGGPGRVSHVAVLPQALPISTVTAQGRLDGTQTTLHLDAATIAFGTAGAAGPQLSISGTAQELKQGCAWRSYRSTGQRA
jgi:hypothetical protein